jgi:hypothetical protein
MIPAILAPLPYTCSPLFSHSTVLTPSYPFPIAVFSSPSLFPSRFLLPLGVHLRVQEGGREGEEEETEGVGGREGPGTVQYRVGVRARVRGPKVHGPCVPPAREVMATRTSRCVHSAASVLYCTVMCRVILSCTILQHTVRHFDIFYTFQHST